MTQHHKNVLVLSGQQKPKSKGRILSGSEYPYMSFEKDTWRKQSFFQEAKNAYDRDDERDVWNVVKKVWINYIISTIHERVRMNKQGRLDPEYLLSLCEDNCPCCGRAMWYGRVHNFVNGYEKPSLDRLDPKGGYTTKNTWVICNSCNTKKNNSQSPIELIQLGLAWHNRIKEGLKQYEKYEEEFPSLSAFFGEL